MILVGGANVYPAEVEAALDEHPAVTSSCVIGLPDEEYGNAVHAIVQAATALSASDLEEYLAVAARPLQASSHLRVRGDAAAGRRRQGPAHRAARRAHRLASMRRVPSALLALLLLGAGAASADDWPGPRVFATFSDNGRFFVRIVPGDSVGDTVGFAGAPKGRYATALLYALGPDRGYRLQQEITLVNPVSPLSALVADDGAFITFDNWHNVGFGKVVAIYAPDRPAGPRLGADGSLRPGQGGDDPPLGVLARLAVRPRALRRPQGAEARLCAGGAGRVLRVHAGHRRGGVHRGYAEGLYAARLVTQATLSAA